MAHPPIDASAGEHTHLDQQEPEPEQRFVDDLDASSDDDPEACFVVDVDKAPMARPGGLDSLMAHNAALRLGAPQRSAAA